MATAVEMQLSTAAPPVSCPSSFAGAPICVALSKSFLRNADARKPRPYKHSLRWRFQPAIPLLSTSCNFCRDLRPLSSYFFPTASLHSNRLKVPRAVASAETTIEAKPHLPLSLDEASNSWKLPPVEAGKRVVLVRHGESTWNASGRIQGSSDFSVLTQKGEGQAETSRQMLASDNFDICFHSPLQRSARTAEIIWDRRSAPMEALHDLREIDLYSFQGLFKDEGKERFGPQYRMWQIDAANFEIDGHFPVRELWDRARKCWELILRSPAKSILVVAHNAVNQAMVATAIGLGPEYFRKLLQSNCGVSVLDFSPDPASSGTSLVSLNRLNQTPSPPVGAQQSAGRKAKCRAILVCNGITEAAAHKRLPSPTDALNMLGVVQARKTSELLLDTRVNSIFSSPYPSALGTASAIYEFQVSADCLGADCTPRDVDIVPLACLRDVDYGRFQSLKEHSARERQSWLLSGGSEELGALKERSEEAWDAIRQNLLQAEAAREAASSVPLDNLPGNGSGGVIGSDELRSGVVIAVTHSDVLKAMIGSCLGISVENALAFEMDEGGLSVVDFPEGANGYAVVRCLNYTAHFGRWAVPVTRPTFEDDSF